MGKYTVTSGVVNSAIKAVIYGVEGIGKSTLVSQFPNPVFIDTEGSTNQMNVSRMPKPTSWTMLIDEVQEVAREGKFKTLIIDTADWAEHLCTEHICSIHNKKGVEDFGYGNGYTYVAEEWGRFLNLLQHVVDTAKIHVVLTAHSIIRKFEQPDEMGAYDRYELKLGKKTTAQTAPITKEWADMVIFLNYKTYVVASDDKGKKFKGQGGQRVMYTTRRPAWDAKNRFGLADELPLNYSSISHIFERETSVSQKEIDEFDSFYSAKKKTEPVTLDAVTIPEAHEIKHIPLTSELEGIPQALKDLMISNKVNENEIREVVASRGYFPIDTPVQMYPHDFISAVLVGAWPKVYETIINLREKNLNMQF